MAPAHTWRFSHGNARTFSMPNVSAPPSSSGMAIIGSVVIVVVGVVYYVVTMLGYGTSLEYHDAGCKLVNPEDMAGSEDFTSMGGGAFLVSVR